MSPLFVDRLAPQAEWRLAHKVADRAYPAVERALRRALTMHFPTAAVIGYATHHNVDQVVSALDWTGLQRAMRRDVWPVLLRTYEEAGRATAQASRRGQVLAKAGKPKVTPTLRPPSIAFNVTNPAAQEWAAKQSAELITNVTDQTKAAVRKVVESAFKQEIPPSEIARRIRPLIGLNERQTDTIFRMWADLEDQGLGDAAIERAVSFAAEKARSYRASMIARTESIASSNAGQVAAWRQAHEDGMLASGMMKEWIATPGFDSKGRPTTCEFCQDLDGTQVGLDEDFESEEFDPVSEPPLHPMCVIGETRVLGGGYIAATSQRWYEGDLMVINVTGGNQLSCTENHPILTPHGWVAAHLLREGDDVICSSVSEGPLRLDANDVNVPTMIEQVSGALRVSRSMARHLVVVRASDFHGDGRDGEIAVIWADRLLRDRAFSSRDERVMYALLQLSHGREAANGFSVRDLTYRRVRNTAHRIMCSIHEMGSFLLSQACPSSLVSCADPGAASMSSGSLCLPLLLRRESPPESGRRSPRVERMSFSPNLDISSSERREDSWLTDTIPSAESLDRFAGHVTANNIRRIDRRRFAGHVYNLETESGLFVAGGIVTHNCRCAVGLVRGR